MAKSDLTVVHSGDLHLDATHNGGWDPEHGVHRNWVESFRQLNRIIDVCNEVDANVLDLSGDIFDTGRPPAEAVGLMLDAMKRLDPRTKVVIKPGNHDQQTVVGQHRNPIQAYLAEQPWCFAVQTEPSVVEIDGFQIAGAPWLRVAGTSAREAANQSLQVAVERMAAEIGNGPSLFTGHVVLDECTFGNVERRGSEVTMVTSTLEASIAADVLEQGPWGIARLSHIHKRQQLTPKVGYVGSPYKVSFGETHEAKGCDVIRYNSKGVAKLEFVEFDVRQLIKADVSQEGGDSSSVVVERAKKGDIVRFILDNDSEPKGFTRDHERLKKKGVDVQIQRKPKERVEAVQRVRGLETDTNPLDALRVYMDRQGLDPDRQKRISGRFQDLSS